MKTKLIRLIPLLAVAVVLSACNSLKDELELYQKTTGKIALSCDLNSSLNDVTTRAEGGTQRTFQLPQTLVNQLVPSGKNLKDVASLSLTGTVSRDNTQYSNSWASVAAYEAEGKEIEAGKYKAVVEIKPTLVDGAVPEGKATTDKLYFKGESDNIEVKAFEEETVAIVMTLVNSCFTLNVTKNLLDYYESVEFTIHTAKNTFKFTPTAGTNGAWTSDLYMVNAGQPLKLSGKAVKQNGTEVEFKLNAAAVEISEGNIAGSTHYDITIDHTTAGAGTLEITFGDNYTTYASESTVDLNPDADE